MAPSDRRSLAIAMMGTRGVPARYGGFETAVEEIGRRLVARGHRVTVYCRATDGDTAATPAPIEHLGMRLVTLPALRAKSLETLTHTAMSSAHAVSHRQDVVFLFNSANSVFVPLLHARRMPVAVHVDGLEWRRAKWSGAGQRYYRGAESLAVRWADALIADAQGIADYYREEFDASTAVIAYGAPVLRDVPDDRLAELGLAANRYHLVVARFEPENHVEMIVAGYRRSSAELPLVVVGAAPYSDDYTASVHQTASGDSRIRLLGSVWDQTQLDQLYAHSRVYLHGHSVGGTNPSLLRAMGAGAAISAYDVGFNREVLGDGCWVFSSASDVARAVESAEADCPGSAAYGAALRERAAAHYRWDDVAAAYDELALRLADGWTRRHEASGRRLDAPRWRRDDLPRTDRNEGMS
ncbi:MAG TPA: DUF1972 domain-containing protein [Microthrixaceae bacterium]|nr:DUF1972 domain-containing protein [Microthrixaceae bacterium]